MPVVDRTIATGFRDQMLNTDFGSTGWVLKDYIIDVYPNLVPGVKTPALWIWGENFFGKLGDNTVTNKSSPIQTVAGGTNWKQVTCGYGSSAAVKTDGTLWLWGDNYGGQLGDNTSTGRSSPIQTVAGGTNWSQVACGLFHSSAIKTDGTLWTWGSNANGELGDNTSTNRSSPVQTVTGGTNWKQIACGYRYTAALKTDGTLWTWGSNANGRLGDGTITNRSSPVQTVTGGTNWKQVTCGNRHTAAIKTDGTLWTWGPNNNGKLGDNTVTDRSSPVQTVAGGTNWSQVSGGYHHTGAVKTDGTLWTWGFNNTGQLGDNTITNRSSPIQTVTGGTNWKQVDCMKGGSTTAATAAIKVDGTLWTWGPNNNGQLGENTTTDRSSPVQTIMRGTTWKQVTCGKAYCAAIADGNY